MAGDASEKRGFTRVPFSTEVELRIGERTLKSQSGVNVSMRGVRVSIDEAVPPVGSVCAVTVVLAASGHREYIFAEGKIVRAAAGDVAVEFTSLDLDSYHHLRQLIINNADDPVRAEQEFIAHWGIRRPAG